MDAELVQRLGWAERRVDLEAGRYDTVLPPTAVADLMIYAYWTAAAREAHDGQTVFSKRGGGTRIGERLSRQAAAHVLRPGVPPARGARRSSAPSSSNEIESVFDNGLPLCRTDWIRNGTLTALLQNRLLGAARPASPSRRTSTTWSSRSTAPPAAPRTWSPASSAACW